MASDNSQVSSRPIIDETQAIKLSQQFFGLQAKTVKEFDSYGDRNFYIKGKRELRGFGDEEEAEFVLKILNHVDSTDADFIDALDLFSLFLKRKGFECPVPLKSLNGDYKIMWKNPAVQEQHEGRIVEAIRLLTFVQGIPLKCVPPTSGLMCDTGKYMARFDKAAQTFSHPGIEHRVYQWGLQHFEKIEHYITNFEIKEKGDEHAAELLKFVHERFHEDVLPRLPALAKQIIHSDFNEDNILVAPEAGGYRISGILDFGDMCFSYRPFEVAICMAHMIMMTCEADHAYSRAMHAAGQVLNGYQETFPLSHAELDLLYWSVAARICQTVALGQHQGFLDPSNVYVQSSVKTGKQVLRHYLGIPKVDMMKMWSSEESGEQA